MSASKQVIKNFIWLAFGQLLSAILGFIYVIYLARVLGVAAFGLLSYVQAFLVYFLIVVDAGFSTYGIREIAKDKLKIDHLPINLILLKTIWALSVFLISMFVVFFLSISPEIKILFAATIMIIIPFGFSPDWVYQGMERFDCVSYEKIFNRAVFLLLIVIFVKSSSDLLKVPMIEFIVGTFTAVVLFAFLFIKIIPFSIKEIRYKNWKNYFFESIPLGISFIFIQLYYNIDSVMLGLMNDIEGVGLYNAAYKIIFALLLFATILGRAIFPALSRLYIENKAEMKKLVERVFTISLFLGMPIAVAGTVLSSSMILFIYGKEYSLAHLAFQILVWSILTVYTNVPFAFSLLAAGRQKEYLYSVGSGAAINIILNLYFIPHYGFVGSAIATIITEAIVWGILYFYCTKYIFYVSIFKSLYKIIFSSLIMGIVIYFTKDALFLSVFLGAAIYIVLNLLLKTVKMSEVLMLRNKLSS